MRAVAPPLRRGLPLRRWWSGGAAVLPPLRGIPTHASENFKKLWLVRPHRCQRHALSSTAPSPSSSSSGSGSGSSSSSGSGSSPSSGSGSDSSSGSSSWSLRDNFWPAVFLGSIVSVVAYFYRSSQNSSNFGKVRQRVADRSALDLTEIKELRAANDSLDLARFSAIAASLPHAFPDGTAKYSAFVDHVSMFLDAPLKLGHYVDRIVLMALEEEKEKKEEAKGEESNVDAGDWHEPEKAPGAEEPSFDWRLLMAALVLAMRIEYIEDRTDALFAAFQHHPASVAAAATQQDEQGIVGLAVEDVTAIVDCLVKTHQLPPEKLVQPTEQKYPLQQYREASPEELVRNAMGSEDLAEGLISPAGLVTLLSSKEICAWGCCNKRESK